MVGNGFGWVSDVVGCGWLWLVVVGNRSGFVVGNGCGLVVGMTV